MRIICDLDSTVSNTLWAWLDEYNAAHGDTLTIDKVNVWGFHVLAKAGKAVYAVLARPGFFRGLQPLPGAVEALQELQRRGHDVYIVSSTSGDHEYQEKELWCKEHLPFIPRSKLFFGADKFVMKADAIIDDAPHTVEAYVKAWPEAKVLGIGFPYNAAAPYTAAVGDWRDPATAWKNILEQLP